MFVCICVYKHAYVAFERLTIYLLRRLELLNLQAYSLTVGEQFGDRAWQANKSLIFHLPPGPIRNFFKIPATAGGARSGAHVGCRGELARSDPRGPGGECTLIRRPGNTLPQIQPPRCRWSRSAGPGEGPPPPPAAQAGPAERRLARGSRAPPRPPSPALLPACRRRGAAPPAPRCVSGSARCPRRSRRPSPLAAARQQQVSIKVLVRSGSRIPDGPSARCSCSRPRPAPPPPPRSSGGWRVTRREEGRWLPPRAASWQPAGPSLSFSTCPSSP